MQGSNALIPSIGGGILTTPFFYEISGKTGLIDHLKPIFADHLIILIN